MSIAAVIVAPGRRPARTQRTRRSASPGNELVHAAEAASRAGYDEIIIVVDDERAAAALPEQATVLLDHSGHGAAPALRSAIDWCQQRGHEALVVALAPRDDRSRVIEASMSAWEVLRGGSNLPIAVACDDRGRSSLIRLSVESWALVPLEGDPRLILDAHPSLVTERLVPADAPSDEVRDPVSEGSGAQPSSTANSPSAEDRAAVAAALGRAPSGGFRVAVRDAEGLPMVIENDPFLDDGTPMPTRYWLVGRKEAEAVGRLEAAAGVRRAAEAVAPELIEAAHRRHAEERDRLIPAGHVGPRPTGGVGGTRVGVKCLHAHLAWYLAGGSDPVGRWVATELRGELRGPVAAIDCGTNSTRLLIASAGGETLERQMTITRLGEGVDQTGRLGPAAISRTVEVLARYREAMDHHGVVDWRATATSAARDAANAEEFFSAAGAVLGAPPELIAGTEEGRLSYAGATAGLDETEGPYLVVDLGGGSTELVAGGAPGEEPAATISLDFGCVRVTERFLLTDPPTESEIAAARQFVADQVQLAIDKLPALLVPKKMVGVAGTVSTLVQLSIGLNHYNRDRLHHVVLGRSEVERLAGELLAEPLAERRSRPGVEVARADVIAGGALILEVVMAALGHDALRYSESDILDGIVISLLARRA